MFLIENLMISIVEWIGWLANLVVVIQFTQKDMWKLRVWGIVAATLWAVYGGIIQSWPLMSLNVILFGIHLYHLRKLSMERRRKNLFGNDN